MHIRHDQRQAPGLDRLCDARRALEQQMARPVRVRAHVHRAPGTERVHEVRPRAEHEPHGERVRHVRKVRSQLRLLRRVVQARQPVQRAAPAPHHERVRIQEMDIGDAAAPGRAAEARRRGTAGGRTVGGLPRGRREHVGAARRRHAQQAQPLAAAAAAPSLAPAAAPRRPCWRAHRARARGSGRGRGRVRRRRARRARLQARRDVLELPHELRLEAVPRRDRKRVLDGRPAPVAAARRRSPQCRALPRRQPPAPRERVQAPLRAAPQQPPEARPRHIQQHGHRERRRRERRRLRRGSRRHRGRTGQCAY